MDKTAQMEVWSGEFGKAYTERNMLSLDDVTANYESRYGKGITPLRLKSEFVGKLDKDIRILEVGTNIGNQLLWLQKLGFKNLYGIELQDYAIEKAKIRTENIFIIKASALDIPFKDLYFELVFTDGVLIHISPDDLRQVMLEMCRCTSKYIWGFEYYADQIEEIPYHEYQSLMWRGNYADKFIENCPDLSLVKEKKLTYLENGNQDQMYLLSK